MSSRYAEFYEFFNSLIKAGNGAVDETLVPFNIIEVIVDVFVILDDDDDETKELQHKVKDILKEIKEYMAMENAYRNEIRELHERTNYRFFNIEKLSVEEYQRLEPVQERESLELLYTAMDSYFSDVAKRMMLLQSVVSKIVNRKRLQDVGRD